MRLGFRVTHVLTQRCSPKVSAEFNRLATLVSVHAATDLSRRLHGAGQHPASFRASLPQAGATRNLSAVHDKTSSRTISVLPPRSLRRVRIALWPIPARLLQTPRGAYQCPRPCAAPKSSIARPTSTAEPARRDSP